MVRGMAMNKPKIVGRASDGTIILQQVSTPTHFTRAEARRAVRKLNMTKPDDVPPEMVETFLSNLDSIEPFRRENSTMSPQEYRRYRIREALRPVIQAERKRCADTIANFPEWVAHSDEVAAETGMPGRQTTRADIVAAVLNPKF